LLDAQKTIDFIKKGQKEPPLKYFLKPFLWALKFIYRVFLKIPEVKAMHLSMEIYKLERQKNYDDARRLREKWLKKPEIAKFPELWLSQGNDLLFNKEEPQKALYAFERAIRANKDYNPIELYYGATCSAILNNQTEKAKKYYLLFNKWWDKFMMNPKLKGYYFTEFLGCKNWLDSKMKRYMS
jgi:tetratricopeptide (TPR) repeat protein